MCFDQHCYVACFDQKHFFSAVIPSPPPWCIINPLAFEVVERWQYSPGLVCVYGLRTYLINGLTSKCKNHENSS